MDCEVADPHLHDRISSRLPSHMTEFADQAKEPFGDRDSKFLLDGTMLTNTTYHVYRVPKDLFCGHRTGAV